MVSHDGANDSDSKENRVSYQFQRLCRLRLGDRRNRKLNQKDDVKSRIKLVFWKGTKPNFGRRSMPSTWRTQLLLQCILILLANPNAMSAGDSSSPKLLRLSIFPQQTELVGAQSRQQFCVTGHFADGSLRDLTTTVAWKVDHPQFVTIATGIAFSRSDGETNITASFEGKTAQATIRVRDSSRQPRLSFRNDVMPIFSKASCNAGTCHGNFNGKNGFRLSLRGENPEFDRLSLTRDTLGRRTNLLDPAASLLLQKPTGELPHEGGIRFQEDSHEYQVLHRWIREGAKPDSGKVAALTKLEVFPQSRVLWHGVNTQQLSARATFSDGSIRDVTHLAVYEPNNEEVGKVSSTGLVHAEKSGQITVVVRFLEKQVACRLAFVPERENFVWKEPPHRNYIDDHVFARLRELQIEPSAIADEATFLRRAYLDVLGVLPTASEVKVYLADSNPNKRAALIDDLLQRPEYADFWAMKWADLLGNEEKAVDAKGVRLFYDWLRVSVGKDKPVDQFARELLLSRGSTYENPAANYFRTNLEPQKSSGDNRPTLHGRSHRLRPLSQSPLRPLDTGRLLWPVRVLRPRANTHGDQQSQGSSRQTRTERRNDRVDGPRR
jgi:hypothetical protein